jgi:hypothetical protein
MSKPIDYTGLLSKLQQHGTWPQVFVFKFIIPNDNQKLAQTEGLFGPEAHVTINPSRTGKYLSVSAKELMLTPEEVINQYKKAGQIEGLMSL